MRIPAEILRQCRFLAGPTACGKTAVGLVLAERIGAEILSLDSMAIYRGMDVGTAKPTPEEQARAAHHLIDLADPWEEYSVAQYLEAAERAIRETLGRGKVPLFVGGTGLYLRSVLRGIFEGPPADAEVRRSLEARYDEIGPEAFYAELAALDPVAAERVHPNDARRLVRAREVFELTGKAISSLRKEPPLEESERPRSVLWLHPPREWLYERVNRRVDRMIEGGLAEEVRGLLELPQGLSKTARQAIGYKELFDALEGGTPIEDSIETIKSRSRQLARRQHTWFRNLEECRAIEISGEESAEEIAERFIALGGTGEGD